MIGTVPPAQSTNSLSPATYVCRIVGDRRLRHSPYSSQKREYPWPSTCSVRCSSHRIISVTLRRLSSSCTFDQSGSRFVEPSWKLAGANSSPSNAASPISGGIGHVIPTTLARLTYSETAVLPTPVASRTSRTLSPSSCVSRSTSRIFLIDILILAIGSPRSSQGLPISDSDVDGSAV